MTDLQEQTNYLKQQLDQLKERYEGSQPPQDMRDKAFFSHVKEITGPIYEQLNTWEENTLHMVKNREVNLHPQQVESTKENMEVLLMHSFYIDVRRKRYMELYKSIHFIFDQLLKDIR